MATKEKKQEIVAELEDLLTKSQVTLVADLSGLTVAELTQFRRKLDKDNAKCRIAKNTLIELAASKHEMTALGEILKGPSALVLGWEDPIAPTKTTVQFLKTLKKGTVRGAYFEGKLLTAEQVKEFAELPSREELYAAIAGGLDNGARNIACMLEALIRDIALMVEEVAKKTNAA